MSEIDLKALGQRVIVKEFRRRSSLFFPQLIEKRMAVGKVLSIGEECDLSNQVKVGDIVIYNYFDGMAFARSGDKESEFRVLKEDSLIAVVAEEHAMSIQNIREMFKKPEI